MESRERRITRVTVWGAAVNLMLTGLKLLAGVAGRSSAMIADAIHSLSDLISDFIILIFLKVSSKGNDRGHDYGHGKFETLSTTIVALLLFVVGLKLIIGGTAKIRMILSGGNVETPGRIALWAAIVSILFKEMLFHWTNRVGKDVGSHAVIANAWHHRTDALSSVASFIGIGAAILFGGKWIILDPAVCCIISIVIIFISVRMILPALDELTDGSLPEETEALICKTISDIYGVRNVHELKTRKSGPALMMEAHIVVDPEMTVTEAHHITEEAEEALRSRFGDETHISLHVEPSEECS